MGIIAHLQLRCPLRLREFEKTQEQLRITAETKGEADGRLHSEQRAELVRLGCLQEKTFPCDLSHRSSAYRFLLLEILSTRTRYPEIEIDYPEHRSIHVWGEPRLL